jgi:hypothetical protein
MNKSPTGRAPTSPEIQELINRTRSVNSNEVLLQLDYWALEQRMMSIMEYQHEPEGKTK